MIKLFIIHSLDFRLANLSPIHTLQKSGRTTSAAISRPNFGIFRKAKAEQKAQPLTASSPGNLSHWVLPFSTAGLPQLLGTPPMINANQHRFLNGEQPECPHYEISSFSDSASSKRTRACPGLRSQKQIYSGTASKTRNESWSQEWSYTENSPEETARHFQRADQLPKAWWSLLCLV